MEEENVIQVNKTNQNGQYRCPNCGSSEITPNPKTNKLKCDYCQTEFEGEPIVEKEKDLRNLKGVNRGSNTNKIKKDAEDVVTLRCGGCGAEVVIDTAHAPEARCHWCRSILSINDKLDNGAIPDAILPFSTKKEEARTLIEGFVGKRKFYAHPRFKKEFTTENIMGVYFPYLLVDANCHAKFNGVGEHLVRKYTVGSGDNRRTKYDADAYNIERDFDITIDGLSIESNSNRLDKTSNTQTNNIINSIMPFDTENCISYRGNYLVGYTSERRDVNIDELTPHVENQLKDIARFAAKETCKFYDRGVHWNSEELNVKGTMWISAYLPVWLYSYMQVKGNKKILHYVAVNARTNETMGSVPINQPLLLLVSAIIEVVCGAIGIALCAASTSDDDNGLFFLLLLLSGFVYYGIMYSRYRNKGARHTYEKETKRDMYDLKSTDDLLEHLKGLNDPFIKGCNDSKLEGDIVDKALFSAENLKKQIDKFK